MPLREAMRTLEHLVDLGWIRYIGVSNFSVEELEIARSFLSKYDVVVNQMKYSLMDRRIERDVLPYCSREEITVMAYSPLERGILARNYVLRDIGKKYGRSACQVALNWIILHKNVMAIPKSEKISRLKEFADSMNWKLSYEDFEFLNRYFK